MNNYLFPQKRFEPKSHGSNLPIRHGTATKCDCYVLSITKMLQDDRSVPVERRVSGPKVGIICISADLPSTACQSTLALLISHISYHIHMYFCYFLACVVNSDETTRRSSTSCRAAAMKSRCDHMFEE